MTRARHHQKGRPSNATPSPRNVSSYMWMCIGRGVECTGWTKSFNRAWS